MLDGYGIRTLIWDSADERLGDFLVASPADATGRGLELHVRDVTKDPSPCHIPDRNRAFEARL